MKLKIINLVRKNIQKLVPYQSARKIGGKGEVWLNANESPMSNQFTLQETYFNRYPEPQPKSLIMRYADYVGISSNNILVTRGADEGIELLMRAFCEPKIDSIIYCPPTYDMYVINANIFGVKVCSIPMLKNWQLDVKSIEKKNIGVKLIYICSPNNPTGNIIHSQDIFLILKIFSNTALVIVDEAYIEFCENKSIVSWLQNYPNLVILRTLSKAFALAGLRCGFVLANTEIIRILSRVIAPYPLPTPVTDIAYQALSKKNIGIMKNRVLELCSNKMWLIKELKKIKYVKKIFKSDSNYILVHFINADKIFLFLWEQGIIVRNQNFKIFLNECIRISIGNFNECLKLINVLKLFVTNSKG
ncbi:histidinol-phosphate transaminase [Buchnera aphidicola]|uniref:histidinol-phosphate transaminase n=1 Tax=Buchnera aphidicola TaxID=9 RepID=UPI00346405FF